MDNRADLITLNRNPWFAGLPPALAQNIVRLGQVRQVRDALLFESGDEPNGLFGVLAGDVRLSHSFPDGQLGFLLVVRAGSWFGETSLFDERPRFLDAFAVGRCIVLHLSMRSFRKLAHESVQHYKAFVRLQCDHYRLAMTHIASLESLPVVVRVAQRLIFFSQEQSESGKPAHIVRLSQDELASSVGVSRQALNVHLKQLEGHGIIALGYRVIRLRNFAALDQMIRQRGQSFVSTI